MRLTHEIMNNEARRLENVKLRKQLLMWRRFGRQIQPKPKVTPLNELKTLCAARRDWTARGVEYKKYEEYGGEMPIVYGWPYDLMTLEDLVLNVAQPTAGAITECGKSMEFRKWQKHWGLRPRLFMLYGTNPAAWHTKYVTGACDALGIKMPDPATGKKKTYIYTRRTTVHTIINLKECTNTKKYTYTYNTYQRP